MPSKKIILIGKSVEERVLNNNERRSKPRDWGSMSHTKVPLVNIKNNIKDY
jgi:hypothetical protein